MELLQECAELLLWWRQVPQSHLFPERTLWELPAAETGQVWGAGYTASVPSHTFKPF